LKPLVSIIVITYNSEKYVAETLKSTLLQNYPNLELIITDDCSTDKTIDICKDWTEKNRDRFTRIEISTYGRNSGIPANLNRGIKLSRGEWIKSIAGDDFLAENCISDLISHIILTREDIQVLSSDYIKFHTNPSLDGILTKNPNVWFCSREVSVNDQYQMLLRGNRVFASTIIIKRDLLELVNNYDERFRLLEDWPLWVKITSLGFKIYHLAKPLVFYRVHERNLSQVSHEDYLYHPVFKTDISFREVVIMDKLPFIEKLGLKYKLFGIKVCFYLGNDRKNILTTFIYHAIEFFNPLTVYIRLSRFIGLKYSNLKYITESGDFDKT
jgi:glycosyltransferase involved in cell wall biosynthesis